MNDQKIAVDNDSRWEALISRDRRAEGTFWYGVATTGVFCRPGCPARLPRRENVEFFDSPEAAQTAGYRPCKRCRPDAASPSQQLTRMVVNACRSLEQAEVPPPLETLAAEAGLSPAYFHRVFKNLVGLTPKQYANSRQSRRFRDTLKHSPTVTQAVYEAGFSSSSRAYTQSRERLAMTPSTYRRGGAGLSISYGTARCSLGWVLAASTGRGICAIELGEDPDSLACRLKENFPKASHTEAGTEFCQVIHAVVNMVERPDQEVQLPLNIQGTAFQERVWNELTTILPGSTVSYAELAERLGQPGTARAVAQACAANKLAVALPCHRVVRADGSLGGYRWGQWRKQRLLQVEREESGTGQEDE